MKFLVTGAYGFIASHFIRKTLIDGHCVVGLARYSDQRNVRRLDCVRDYMIRHNGTYSKGNYLQMVFVDLNDRNLTEVVDACDMVVNFAAKTYVDYSVKDAKPFFDSNVLGTYNLLEAIRKSGRIRLLVQVSTDEVYGALPDERPGWKEDSPLNPTNPYSASKAASDMLCLGHAQTYGIPLLLTRTENNYGYYQHPQKVIPNWVRHALKGDPIPIYGDGEHRRMWLRVEDHVDALQMLIRSGARGIYHIAGGQELSNNDLADIVLKTLGRPANDVQYIDTSKIRPNHDRRYGLDTAKIRALGWAPKYGLVAGIEDAVRWYAANLWWVA